MASKKKALTFGLKAIFSLFILIFLLTTQTSVKEVMDKLKGANLAWLFLSFSLHAFGLFASAFRWQILARAQGDDIPLGFLAKSYLVGTFFNNFLPTRFGGDVIRIWDGSRFSRSLLKSSAIVLVERFTGIIILFLFALFASFYRLDMAKQIPVIWGALLLGLFGLALVLGFFTPLTAGLFKIIPSPGILKKALDKVILFRETILRYRTQKGPFLRATWWAFLLQLNVILYYFLIGKALHLKIHFIDYFIFIPIVLIIQLIPITINGLGLREGSYIEIFKFYGISPQTAFSFSLIDVGFVLILGIIGGFIYVTRK
ncbi:MAG: lysylphosphatidylglycerol synthase transmembrane domain-containing protein [Candidatus Aminicenantales bacterium]